LRRLCRHTHTNKHTHNLGPHSLISKMSAHSLTHIQTNTHIHRVRARSHQQDEHSLTRTHAHTQGKDDISDPITIPRSGSRSGTRRPRGCQRASRRRS
jgi:hypothetical protein